MAYMITGTAREVRAYMERHGYITLALLDELIDTGYVEFTGDVYRFYEMDDDGEDYGVDFQIHYRR